MIIFYVRIPYSFITNINVSVHFFVAANDADGFAPSFTEKPKIIPNDLGTLITMKCKCKGKPGPIVTWYRGQTEINEDALKYHLTVVASQSEDDHYEITLEIKVCIQCENIYLFKYKIYFVFKDPSGPDGGTYRCHVKNEFGESNANLNLNIESEPEPEGDGPVFIEKPRIISEANGKIVVMECKVKSYPKPDIHWTCNGKNIAENHKILLNCSPLSTNEENCFLITLELKDPVLDDSGLYKCNIKNNLGELNANLTLNIESK